MSSAMPAMVAEVYAQWPEDAKALRALIFQTAEDTGTGPLTETLKWGQPAYLTDATKAGTTVRLGYVDGADDPFRVYVHCQTNLVDRYRERFGAELAFEGDRAICVPADLGEAEAPLRQCIAMALTYHRDKREGHR